jgi:uncharacterized repeat protein (TIGR01451 family)/fimbrial isopeptide formation D2 family protein
MGQLLDRVSHATGAGARGSRIGLWLLLLLALSMVAASPAQAVNCSDPPYFGLIDGNVVPAPDQIQIDTNCTIQNYPASNPLSTNFSFFTSPGQSEERHLVIFNNVVHTGNMSCNATHGHMIWFTNGSSTKIKDNCQNLLIPVEKIDKQNPAATATVGVPFTYSLAIPVLFDPATDTVINNSGSPNTLHGITIWDDLNATGADLSYISHTMYWLSDGTPVPHTFTNAGGELTFELPEGFVIPAGEQIMLEITVVLDDSPANTPGTQFVNTAIWEFGRLIDGEFFSPLPGENGVTPPMTIVAPNLIVTKSGPGLLGGLNLGEEGVFTIDVHNAGPWAGDAWSVTVLDRLPREPSNNPPFSDGGMCDFTPEVNGVTLAGNPLVEGVDYTLAFTGVPVCELSLTLLEAAGPIGPDQHLVIEYMTKLDADSENGAELTNVAVATQWFNDDSSNSDRQSFACPPPYTGTEGINDCQDAHALLVVLSGNIFEKTVENLTTGENPATIATAGDRLRYTLRLQTTEEGITNFRFYDELDRLNTPTAFVPGTLDVIGPLPPGAVNVSDANGGPAGTGLIDIRNLSLAAGSQLSIQFEITLDPTLAEGTIVLNQADLIHGGATIAVSDDPNINGQANPAVTGDEDPTRIVIQEYVPPLPLKTVFAPADAEVTIGEVVTYEITVPGVAATRTLDNIVITDVLDPRLEYLGFSQVSGPAVTDNSAAPNLSYSVGQLPAGQQVVIRVIARVLNSDLANDGDTIENFVAYTYDGAAADATSQTPAVVTIVEPQLTLSKIVFNATPGKQADDAPETGDTLEYRVIVENLSDAMAFDLNVVDTLPPGLELDPGFAPVATINGIPVAGFVAEPAGAPAGALTWGRENGDGSLDLQAGGTLILTYHALVQIIVDPDGQIENSVFVDWTSLDGASPFERTGAGCPDITPPNDYCIGPVQATTTGNRTSLVFWKSVVNLTSGQDPGHNAEPGDTLRYRIEVQNPNGFPVSGFSLRDELDARFAPGTLSLVTVPAGADATNTSPTGGANGTGIVDIRNLTLAEAGAPNDGDRIIVEFDATLAPVIDNGAIVANQAQFVVGGEIALLSDDPFDASGPADPDVPGDEEPTLTLISSAAALEVLKTSEYLGADPAVLLAGETLRYNITVHNTGNENAAGVEMRDLVPANTTYASGSTTLNGAPVADVGGASPLQDGMSINTPGDPAGVVRADPDGANGVVATITFDVIVSPDVADGTILVNQAFVSGSGAGGVPLPEQPSDDPRTPIENDPTRDVVGNLPLVFAHKGVELLEDGGSPGIVDPEDVLRYTITIVNTAATPATDVVLTDPVPENTTYIEDSVRLDGEPVAGVSPPVLEIPIGTLPAGGVAVVTFDVEVNAGVLTGTIISNQGTVTSDELPPQLTCADSDPSAICRPTIVVVGDVQLLTIDKEVFVVGSDTAVAGGRLEYVVRITNVSSVPATDVVITDDLGAIADQLTFVPGSATLNGSPNGVTFAGGVLTADWSATYGDLAVGATAVLRFRVDIAEGLEIGTTIVNTAVVTWNDPPEDAAGEVSIDVGGVPGSAVLNGRVWHDANFDKAFDGDEQALAGWTVTLWRAGQQLATVSTDADGLFRISGLAPNDLIGDPYELRFSAPGAGPATAMLGWADSAFTNGLQQISDIVASSGSNLQDLNLPIEPNGVVYDSVMRTPIAGATLTMLRATNGSPLSAACFDDPAQQGQVTLASGFYKFDLNYGDPSCPAGADYRIAVVAPNGDANAWPSRIIPPENGDDTDAYPVPACPDDAVPATEHCEAQPSALAPAADIPARTIGTRYYLHVMLANGSMPQDSQIFNNHIPVDPPLDAAVAITKTSPMVNVTRAALVPYTITVRNTLAADLQGISIVDTMPPGFKYVEGSARFDGVPMEPVSNGRQLTWEGIALQINEQYELKLLLIVGAGVAEGEFVNTAQVVDAVSGSGLSGIATATVRVVPDPAFDCTDIIGKVFDDANLNGHQDGGEQGLAGVRIVSARGLIATTDAHGRFHITCAAVPDRDRGSNFILKLDERSLPSGYRITTDNPQVQRVTRGKMAKFNFGAAIHRVVGLGVADAVFAPGTADMRPQWQSRIDDLVSELAKAPSLLRITYHADLEDKPLVRARIDAVKAAVGEQWREAGHSRALTIETEIYWRRGGPVDKTRRPGRAPAADAVANREDGEAGR